MANNDVTFFDLFDPNEERSDQEIIEQRLAICQECPLFNKRSRRCRVCGCFMSLKSTLLRAKCPENKW